MMTISKIEWTDRSDWNPIRGCTRVSPGCGPADAPQDEVRRP
jgi:protein gp37